MLTKKGKMVAAVAAMTREEAVAAGWPVSFWETACFVTEKDKLTELHKEDK